MDTLDKLRLKHERKPAPAGNDKDPVAAIMEYLKTCNGFELVFEKGKPVLHFNPGVDLTDVARWQQASHAVKLFINAAEALKDRIRRGKLKLPPHPGY